MKRLFDLLASLILLIVLVPVLAIVAILVRWRLGAPILFSQKRAGRDGKIFTLHKFRTMRLTRAGEDELASDALRQTPLGRFLRASSLDELPTLWNVLVGEMSLIGPRPLLPEYLPLYTAEQMRRHEVTPGITGWAQVNGRNAIPWEEKFRLDVWYVDHRTFGLDLKILWLTLWRVLSRQGVAAEGHATMPPFTGASRSAAEPAKAQGAHR
ncbi:MAG: sugar transferase [Planctomycetes bacterium]|nr:sugar transferase [Planctomycetota bacterium]